MSVFVTLSTTLRNFVPGYRAADGLNLEVSGPTTAGDLAQRLNLPLSEIKIVMINGRRLELATPINDGDRVGYFPAVGGG
ncbi:MAG: MoaD/ThiS family protein [Candidatus Adiutrix sp.]|jgi:molybdopterin converting factor small subunit|nr:MoaD/ThiS family protein [Candidatus Adiutrix sp.]